jgi:hypothetical protein
MAFILRGPVFSFANEFAVTGANEFANTWARFANTFT